MIDRNFWQDKRVFVTGHTGFKGSWLCMWLHSLGAKVTGYSLEPPTKPSLFSLCRIDRFAKTVIADVRDLQTLAKETSSLGATIHIRTAKLVQNW